MTSRIGQPDTPADLELRASLDQQIASNFVMVAGAGSGKTTSLVKALAYLAKTKGPLLRKRRQRIACITYTEVAVGEIASDVGNDPLFHVSTIHSFLWTLVSPFQTDLREWVEQRIASKIADANARIAKPRTQSATKIRLQADISRYQQQQATLKDVRAFTYGTGSNYAKGILGHDDILKLGPQLIDQRPLLRTIIADRFPFIFVDESQDTNPDFVNALRQLESAVGSRICLGFFGDPMQKIYPGGAGSIAPASSWKEITKPENFRCPARVLCVVNKIRTEDDGLQQTRGRTIMKDDEEVPVEGAARLFVLPADDQRTARLKQVRHWLAEKNKDPLWNNDNTDADVRMLVLVHRMAATRLGFPNLYAALHDGAPSSLKDGLVDGSAWVLRPFIKFLLPLVSAQRAKEDFNVMELLRQSCPLLEKPRINSEKVPALLERLSTTVAQLTVMLSEGSSAKIRDVVSLIRDNELMTLDERLAAHLDGTSAAAEEDEEGSTENAIQAFLECSATELWGYQTYVEGFSPFATHQGVKGAEFQRVLVVLDDEEGAHNQFSYGKYFGFTPLSETDEKNIAEGKDSVISRTRRLLYVCCSRAVQDLAVVLFASNVAAAKSAVISKNIFPKDAVMGVEDFDT